MSSRIYRHRSPCAAEQDVVTRQSWTLALRNGAVSEGSLLSGFNSSSDEEMGEREEGARVTSEYGGKTGDFNDQAL